MSRKKKPAPRRESANRRPRGSGLLSRIIDHLPVVVLVAGLLLVAIWVILHALGFIHAHRH